METEAPVTSPDQSPARAWVKIRGAVQGVGFRPFVYRLASELGLAGWVINDSRGVLAEVEGSKPRVEHFLARLSSERPPRAIVQDLEVGWLDPAGYQNFEIRHSADQGDKTVLVLPDIATCAECLAEVTHPADRRFRYPFTNCTNCGPRFSIVQALPYDRPNTTMRRFVMCPDCLAEYQDPLDRRFHAQPNACPACGPRLTALASAEVASRRAEAGPLWPANPAYRVLASGHEALQRAVTALLQGQIVAVKGLGGFHLMVDASNAPAIDRLRKRKPRRDKPFAIMVRDLSQARQLTSLCLEAEALLDSPEAPILLLSRHQDAPVADNVAPDNPTLGIMLPYTPLHHLLLEAMDRPIVATSGNLTDEPICTDEREATNRLGPLADLFLVHDRPIERHVDDSVAWILEGTPRLLRRARGYAPLPVLLSRPVPTILAVGGHLKNTVALSSGRQVFISQHIGDLETAEAMAAFERVIADLVRLYEATPVAIAHDLHPDYLSTRWAREQVIRHSPITIDHSQLIPVQHHHAHLAACLAENDDDGPALGVTWDGTGYGSDGTIWGGEFLSGDLASFQRVAHLRPFRLPGGDAAIKEPRRVALALLWELYGDQVLAWEHLAPVQALTLAERRLLVQMLGKGINSPITTSAGRLFDAIAGLIGLHQQVTFEGQAAMALEFLVDPQETAAYQLPLLKETGVASSRLPAASLRSPTFAEHPEGQSPERTSLPLAAARVLDWSPLLEELLADLQRGQSSGIIAARFHNALVNGIVDVAQHVGQQRVALTGGCFQNRRLTELACKRLRAAGFQVLLHRHVPPNDGGISLGQIAVAAASLSGAR